MPPIFSGHFPSSLLMILRINVCSNSLTKYDPCEIFQPSPLVLSGKKSTIASFPNGAIKVISRSSPMAALLKVPGIFGTSSLLGCLERHFSNNSARGPSRLTSPTTSFAVTSCSPGTQPFSPHSSHFTLPFNSYSPVFRSGERVKGIISNSSS